MPVLKHGGKKEKEKSLVRVIQIDNHRGLLSFRKMDKVQNARIKDLCGVTKEGGRKDLLMYSLVALQCGEDGE